MRRFFIYSKFAVQNGTDPGRQLELETGVSESSPPSQSESPARIQPDSAASITSEIFMSFHISFRCHCHGGIVPDSYPRHHHANFYGPPHSGPFPFLRRRGKMAREAASAAAVTHASGPPTHWATPRRWRRAKLHKSVGYWWLLMLRRRSPPTHLPRPGREGSSEPPPHRRRLWQPGGGLRVVLTLAQIRKAA